MLVAGADRGGLILERKRKIEREQVKEGLRVWLERKAGEIKRRRKDGVGVGVLVWRLTKRAKGLQAARSGTGSGSDAAAHEALEKGKVSCLKRFWEGLDRSMPAGGSSP